MSHSPTDVHPLGRIFTSEPQATRALAAEFCHAPRLTSRVFESLLGVELGPLMGLGVERARDARADIHLTFARATVAVEAKLDHAITGEQLGREGEHADHVVLLVLDESDAVESGGHPHVTVTTWETLLAHFPRSRLLLGDVLAVEDRKRRARRVLQSIDFDMLLPGPDWTADDFPSGSGMPSRCLTVPLTETRWITLQAALHRSNPDFFVVNVGVKVFREDFQPDVPTTEPEWITVTRDFCAALEPLLDRVGLSVSRSRATGNGPLPRVKVLHARQWGLPLHHAVGYIPDYLGLKLEPVQRDTLSDTLGRLVPCVEVARTVAQSAADPIG